VAHGCPYPYHFVCHCEVGSYFPVEGFPLGRPRTSFFPRLVHPRLRRGFKKTVHSEVRTSIEQRRGLLECQLGLASHNLGTSRPPSASSRSRGRGKGHPSLRRTKCSLSSSVRGRSAPTPFSHVPFSHDASFRMPLVPGSSS
jgi:hypothetical protein